MTLSFVGKRVLVTGASSGIGRALVVELTAKGARCTALARRGHLLEQLQKELAERGHEQPEIAVHDLLTDEGLRGAKELTRKSDILINNAGFGMNGRFLTAAHAQVERMFQLNFVVPSILSQEAAKVFKVKGTGGIMNVASIAGMVPTPFHAAYSATKAGLLNFTEGLHSELKPIGVNVTVLCPGVTDTEFFDAGNYCTKSLVYRLKRLSPESVAKAGLQGLSRGTMTVVPGIQTKVLIAATKILPRTWVTRLSGAAMSTD